MNDDLIYRKDAIRETWREPTYSDPLNVLSEMRDRLEALPSVGEERKRGKWIEYDFENDICSVCGRQNTNRYIIMTTSNGQMKLSLVKPFYCGFCGSYLR